MSRTPTRDRKTAATRSRIAETALELFVTQGYAETSIDQIAGAAGVGRRTVFRHFATKEAILFDHFVVRRELAVERLEQRPPGEPPLVSLHAVLRQLSEEGYDRRLLAQIRAVLATEPRLVGEEVALTVQTFEHSLVAVLHGRAGERAPKAHIRALTLMALSWLNTAARTYLIDARPSLVECFDEVVATCLSASARDLAPVLARTSGEATRARGGGG
ncbi:MAG TPA: TetR/AcrR family transcriptional regulator [Acidimicrobiales bacterium]|nr:TetR/AcrR family transcriptional regulator [Acidimicrobiales bacterium]